MAAIAVAPASAPFSLVSNLIQADAYAVSLLGYLLSDSSGLGVSARGGALKRSYADGPHFADFFHAAYALMLAFSCLIPLTAVCTARCSFFSYAS